MLVLGAAIIMCLPRFSYVTWLGAWWLAAYVDWTSASPRDGDTELIIKLWTLSTRRRFDVMRTLSSNCDWWFGGLRLAKVDSRNVCVCLCVCVCVCVCVSHLKYPCSPLTPFIVAYGSDIHIEYVLYTTRYKYINRYALSASLRSRGPYQNIPYWEHGILCTIS